MFQKRTGIKPQSWMGCLGVFGFLGLIAWPLKSATFLLFFVFFSFFSFYWWSKIDYQQPDERLITNQLQALGMTYRFALMAIFMSLLVVCRLLLSSPQLALTVLITAISLTIAVAMNLEAYLLYRYEKEG